MAEREKIFHLTRVDVSENELGDMVEKVNNKYCYANRCEHWEKQGFSVEGEAPNIRRNPDTKSDEEKMDGKEVITRIVERSEQLVEKAPEPEVKVDKKLEEEVSKIRGMSVSDLFAYAKDKEIDISGCKKRSDKQAYLIALLESKSEKKEDSKE